MFTTWTKFEFEIDPNHQGEKPEPIRRGDLPLDFDCKENPGAALQDLKTLCLYHLPEQFGVDAHAIRFYVSGSKGFHAVLPEWLFGHSEGHPQLPLIYKQMVHHFTSSSQCRTLDKSLYCMGRGKMFRLPNVRRVNGRYKVPVSLHEVMTLSCEQLLALSESPRKIEKAEVEAAANDDLKSLWEQADKEVADFAASRSERMPEAKLAQIAGDPPPCIRYLITNLPSKSASFNFNRAVMLLVNYFQDTGADLEEALRICGGFLDGFTQSETYNTPRRRLDHFKKMWVFMSGQTDYFFACERSKGLRMPPEAYECLKCVGSNQVEIETPPPPPPPEIVEPEANTQLDFPFEVMLGHAGFFADAFGSVMEVPPHFLFMGYLTCMGAYFAPLVRFNSE